MSKTKTVQFRESTSNDVGFMSSILIDAAAASGVHIHISDLAVYSDTYQYIEGFPRNADVGVIAETDGGHCVGAAWVRLLPTDTHSIDKHLPELTMGVIPAYRGMGIGTRLMEELYKAALTVGIPEISLGVHKDNLPAIRLYTKQNWIEDGNFGDYVMMSRKTDCF